MRCTPRSLRSRRPGAWLSLAYGVAVALGAPHGAGLLDARTLAWPGPVAGEAVAPSTASAARDPFAAPLAAELAQLRAGLDGLWSRADAGRRRIGAELDEAPIALAARLDTIAGRTERAWEPFKRDVREGVAEVGAALGAPFERARSERPRPL